MHAAGDDALSPTHAVSIDALIGADQRHLLIEVDRFVVVAFRHDDGIAISGRIDSCLDRIAIVDEEHMVAVAANDLLDVLKGIGAFQRRHPRPMTRRCS